MLRRIFFLSLYFFAWILIFQTARLLFIVYHFRQASQFSLSESAGSMWYGLRMDLSMASYILLPVCLFVLASVVVPFFRKAIAYKIYSALVLLLVLLITTADLEVYKQWGFRMDATPLKYLSSPAEAWASVSHLPIGWYLVLFALFYGLICYLFNRFLTRVIYLLSIDEKRGLSALAVVCFVPVLIIPLRGGFQQAPMNQSNVYFSKHAFPNHAAINASWNFLHGVLNQSAVTQNPYKYLAPKDAQRMVDSLYTGKGHTQELLNVKNPNIILIIWESFTAKALTASVEGQPITPHFNRLRSEGVFFSNLWASGDRTDKGLAAILSGYPALPASSVIRTPGKSAKLSALTKIFKERGYATPFYYGGEAAFANMKSYLLQAGCDPIIEKTNFPKKEYNSKWGAHDGVVANKLGSDLGTIRQPFFATWLTLSSHEPFEIPAPHPFKSGDDATKFLASVQYTDKVVGDFIQRAKSQPWWGNTLIIIVADHGHVYPESNKLQNFVIPMLWLGGALKQTHLVTDKVGSQLDMAATVLAQTGVTNHPFTYSKNLLDTTVLPWAFFSFNNGCGFVQTEKAVVWDHVGKQVMMQQGMGAMDTTVAKAVQQVFFQDFLDK